MLYTSRYSNKKLVEVDGAKIPISRGFPKWPLGFPVTNAIMELAPSWQQMQMENREEVIPLYRAKLEKLGLKQVLLLIYRAIGKEENGILLCYEDVRKEGVWCHRTILADWLRENGIEIEEIEKPKPEDTAVTQVSMF